MSYVIDRTLEIAAPAEVVWEVITDFARYGEWNPFILECRSTLKPGDPIDLKVRLLSIPQPQREWINAHVSGQRFAYNMKPMPLGALTSLRSHDVEPAGVARSRYRSHFELNGWLRPVVTGLLGSRLQKGFAGMTEGIQRRAEQLWTQRQSARA